MNESARGRGEACEEGGECGGREKAEGGAEEKRWGEETELDAVNSGRDADELEGAGGEGAEDEQSETRACRAIAARLR